MKVSIIISSYNYSEFLPECLNSILSQSYKNWECIVVDDGSTDTTKEVVNFFVKKYDNIKCIFQDNKGRSVARNLGLSQATGDYIQFLDADDILAEEKLEKQIQIFKNNRDLDVCYCDFYFFRTSITDRFVEDFRRSKLQSNPYEDFLFNFGYSDLLIPIHSPLIKKSFLVRHNIKFPAGINVREDWIFWLSISTSSANFHFIDEKLVYYRKHKNSTVHDFDYVRKESIRAFFYAYESLIRDEYKSDAIEMLSSQINSEYNNLMNKFNSILNSRVYKIGYLIAAPYLFLKRKIKSILK